MLTHLSLAPNKWDMGKQCRPEVHGAAFHKGRHGLLKRK